MKRIIGMLLVMTMVLTLFAACGQNEDSSNTDSTTDSSTGDTSTDENGGTDEKEREKIVIHIHNFLNDASTINAIEEIKTMDKFSHVDFVIKEKDEEYETTLPIAIAGGEQIDIVALLNPILKNQFAAGGIIQPLDEFADKLNVDIEEEYGTYAKDLEFEGNTVMLGHQVTKWVLYYNKKIFDDAGIAYPDPNVPMTWDEYADLAAELTSGEGGNKVYGALHLEWPMFWYGEAIQALGGGEKFYNEEGLSNIEDPMFAKALERTYKMMHEDKSIPTHADIIMSKTTPQAYMGGQYGMFAQGAWLLSWAADKETYPRDWELGIAPLPVDSGTQQKTWGVVNGYGVAQTSANPELAFEVALELSRLDSKYTETAPAANTTYGQEELYVGIAEELKSEGLTLEVIQNGFNNPDTLFVTEKVTGKNNVLYEQVINEEVEKFFIQEQDVDQTIANIKERGDRAIQSN